MSKVVKGVGRVLTKVMKGAAKVIEKTVPGGKKIVKNLRSFHHKYGKKILKAVAIAAAVYFTGGAALGAISGMAAGTGAWAGAVSGLSSAWAGVTGAGSALMAGNLSGAGASLGAGWAGAGSAGAATALGATGAEATAAALSSGAGFGQATGLALGADMSMAGGLAAGSATTAANAIGTAQNVNTAVDTVKQGSSIFSSPIVQQAGVQAIGGMAQSALQAKAANDADKRQDQLTAEERARYNTNVGARLSIFDQMMANRQAYIPPLA